MRRVRFYRNGRWITIVAQLPPGGTRPIDIDKYESVIRMAEVAFDNMKAREPGLDTSYHYDSANKFMLMSNHGRNEIIIIAPPIEVPPKKKRLITIKEFPKIIVPYIRTPNGEGVLLCRGGLNFDEPYVKWDPYERTKGYNYPYAPYIYPVTVGNDIDSYSVYETLPEPTEKGERLLEFAIKQIRPGHEIPPYIIGMMGLDQPRGNIKYEEIPWYGRWWSSAYYKDQDRPEGVLDYELYNAEWWEWNYEGGEEPFTYEYGFEVTSESEEVDEDPFDNTWEYWATTSIKYKGQTIMSATRHSVSVDALVNSSGSAISLVAWAWASDDREKWCFLYKKDFWSDVVYYWYGDPPGTYVIPISGSNYTEFRYKDFTGADVLIETQPGKQTFAGGLMKMHEIGDRTIITFSYYGSLYDQANAPILAGLAEDGNVTITNIKNITDTDDNNYVHPYGQNHIGLMEFKNPFVAINERVMEV